MHDMTSELIEECKVLLSQVEEHEDIEIAKDLLINAARLLAAMEEA